MATTDWALSVGVRIYPGLGDLDGPENDAGAFHEWVTSPAGGDVPAAQAKLILSSQFGPPFPSPKDAAPTPGQIQRFFEDLDDLATANDQKGEGMIVGRRLYLYFAGHGFAPTSTETALLMANATRTRVSHHIPGRSYADWLYRAGYFKEVLLFMDCCRESYPQVPVNNFLFTDRTGAEFDQAQDRERTFYAFATKWSRLSREKALADGKTRGIFTATLLEGLRGAAADRAAGGKITTLSLKSYLYNNMKALLNDADRANPDIPKEPEVEGPKNPGNEFVIAAGAPGGDAATPVIPTYPVRIRVPDTHQGKRVDVLEGGLRSVRSIDAAPIPWSIDLPRGLYKVDLGPSHDGFLFEVKGLAGLGVQDVPA